MCPFHISLQSSLSDALLSVCMCVSLCACLPACLPAWCSEHRLGREEIRSQAMASLPRLTSKKHTGFAFDTPGFESFFAKQVGWAVGQLVGRAGAGNHCFPANAPLHVLVVHGIGRSTVSHAHCVASHVLLCTRSS